MKKTLLLLCLLLPVFFAFAAFPVFQSQSGSASFRVKIGGNGQTISIADFASMTSSDYETLTGKKLGVFGRMHLQNEQRKLRRLLDNDVDATDDVRVYKDLDQSKGFNLAGFMMGFTLSIFGVLAMYLSKDKRKANRAKWAWVGAAFWLVFLLLIIAFV